MSDRNNSHSEYLPEKIISLAKQHGIDLHNDPELLEIIKNVNPKRRLPEEVYALISEIIIQVYKLKDQWKKSP